MEEGIINEKGVCCTCVSKGRNVFKLARWRVIYKALMTGAEDSITPESALTKDLKVCWECGALLQKCSEFRKRALIAQRSLLEAANEGNVTNNGDHNYHGTSLSSLAITSKFNYDHTFVYQHEETEEIEQSPWSVPFVDTNDHSIHFNDVKQEHDDYSDTDIKTVADNASNMNIDEKPVSQNNILRKKVTHTSLPDTEKDPLSKPLASVVKVESNEIDSTKKSEVLVEKLVLNANNFNLTPVKPKVWIQVNSQGVIKKMPVFKKTLSGISKKVVVPIGSIQKSPKLNSDENEDEKMPKPVTAKHKPQPSVSASKGAAQQKGKSVKMVLRKRKPPDPKRNLEVAIDRNEARDLLSKKIMMRNIEKDFLSVVWKKIHQDKYKTIVMSEEEMLKSREEDRLKPQYIDSPYKCEHCIMGYYNKEQLMDHNKVKHTKTPESLECEVCHTYVSNPSLLVSHRRCHYLLYGCLQCEFRHRTPRAMWQHVTAAHVPPRTSWPCKLCDMLFTSLKQRKYHVETRHQEPMKCDFCGKLFASRQYFKQHILMHTDGLPELECEMCQKKYRGKASLRAHMHSVHGTDNNQYRCDECNLDFKSFPIYRQHMRISKSHVQPEQLKHPCTACEKRFVSARALKEHYNFHHLGKTEHVCEICNKIMSSAGGLRKHILYVHKKVPREKNKICEVCGFAFYTRTSLRIHHLIHTGERPYSCEECGATFRQTAARDTHRKLVHLGIKRRVKSAKKANTALE